MKKPLFLFGDIVVVKGKLIGVIVKTWERKTWENSKVYYYDVYVRNYNDIKEYAEDEIDRYRIRHTELNEEEMHYQYY